MKYYLSMRNEKTIIPFPFNTEEKAGFFKNEGKISLEIDNNISTSQKDFFYEYLLNAGLNLDKNSKGSKSININLNKGDEAHPLENTEAYTLEVGENQIKINASSTAGAFYALVSLKALLLSDNTKIDCTFIYDKPEYEWRGFLLDTCRSFYSTDFIKKIIDMCAFHKMNRFHWHLTDDQGWRIAIPEYPKLTEIGSKRFANTSPLTPDVGNSTNLNRRLFYTDKEITEIVEYAQKRNIEIIPEIELPGHSSALLAAYPEFGCKGDSYKVENRWGIFEDVLCAGNDKIFELYDAIFKTVSRLFPAKWIHIGGDECPTSMWEKCPKCQKRIKDEGLSSTKELQPWVTKKMTDIVLSYGKTPIAWDEVIDNTEKSPISKDVIVQSWRGVEGGEKAVKMNHKVIMSPQTMCYLNLKNINSDEEPGRLGFITTKKAYSYTPITKEMSKDCFDSVLGGECTFWAEEMPYSRMVEYMMFPRFCAISESLWLPEDKKDFERFSESVVEQKKRLAKLDVLFYNGRLD